ncbi:MAG: exodeoxyribonuclease VII small subunit [Sulfobacillus acidophilus]|uniref:Exodeoxyribonuclease VII small subunit n=1 Tax=Sulfobacillus acidophilus TaxID=53633 RepID=A0A2T2WPJ1_9FIRM|nr:MAG: exodeoxyribonuclease VII small subunit [Sulfobacillus acidophilus]
MNDGLELDQYETIMARLEDIVKRLEAGRAPLGESLRLYQEAKELSEQANQLLGRAEAMIGPPSSAFPTGDA